MIDSVEYSAAPAAGPEHTPACPSCARLRVRITDLEARLQACGDAAAPSGDRDLGAALRHRRDLILAGLGRYTCREVAAGGADELLRELDAVQLALGRLPQIEQHAARMAEVARTGGLLLLAQAIDEDLPGNTVSARLRAEADAL